MMPWRRPGTCGVFHRPSQKDLVRIIPPSFPVMLCYRGAAHLPARLHRFLLRQAKVVPRRISQRPRLARVRMWAPTAECLRSCDPAAMRRIASAWDAVGQGRPPRGSADAARQRCEGLSPLGIGFVAESPGAAPPRQPELAPPGAAEFVICDHTIETFYQDGKTSLGLDE
jgi:hypothetical protein